MTTAENPTLEPSYEQRLQTLLEGHRRNPLTTTLRGARILSAIMLPWFRLYPPAGFGAICTTGRNTGKTRRRCVRVIRQGNRAFLVAIPGSNAAWLKNIEADPHVRLRIRGGSVAGTARRVVNTGDLDEASDAYCGTVNRMDFLAYVVHRPGRPTPERISDLHRLWFRTGTPLVITLEST